MSNPFSGIVNAQLKQLHTQMITAVIEEGALSVPCKIYYPSTKWEDCESCENGVYLSGSPGPQRRVPNCPSCGGQGKKPVESTEELYLCVIWDYKKWTDLPTGFTLQNADGYAQIFTTMENLPKLKRAKEIILNTDIEQYARHRFVLEGEPKPCGYGQNNFVVATVKRVS